MLKLPLITNNNDLFSKLPLFRDNLENVHFLTADVTTDVRLKQTHSRFRKHSSS